MILTANNLTVSFNDNILFSNLGFSVGKGSIVKFAGKNGSGKTSLLKVIAKISKPFKGEFNSDSGNYSVNYIGHKIAVKPDEAVINNIAFWSALNESSLMLNAAVHYFNLHDVLDEKCSSLSEGLNKKVALARLLAVYADVWVLDEPDAHLDADSRQRLSHAIEVRAAEGGIVFYTSHSDFKVNNAITVNLEDFKNA